MNRFWLPLILFFSLFIRLVWIDRIPSGFTPDEASFGFDAYSILKTGRDQWGKSFPLVFESFGDFKSPLYGYLAIPFVAIFGLNEVSVRLPNAILGSFAVYVVFLLAKKISGQERAGLLSASLLAVSPWHAMLSRGAFEANLITLFVPLGIYLFLIKKFLPSALIFGLGLFTYHSAKLIIPIVFLGLIIIYRKELKRLIVPIATFLLFFLLLIFSMSLGGNERIKERSIAVGALEEGAKIKIELIRSGMNPILARALHNKYQVTINRFINNYLQYFSYRFLFTKGPAETTYGMIPGIGVLQAAEAFLLLGIIPLLLKGKMKKVIIFLVAWLLISPIPAALSTGVGFSANRAAGMMPAIQILSGMGLLGWMRVLGNKKHLPLLSFVLVFLISFSTVRFVNLYFKESPDIVSYGMLYGNLELGRYLKENKGERKVVVSKSLSEPHIFIAFAGKWDPSDYQKYSKDWNYRDQNISWVDQMPSYLLGDYVFQSTDWKKNTGKPGTLLVGRPGEFKDGVVIEKIINYPDGNPAIYIVDSDKNQT